MVADQQRSALFRNLFQVTMLDAVHGVAEQPDHETHGEFRDDLEDCVENVVRGDDPRALLLGRARLDQRVQRHDVKPTEDANAEDVEQHPPRLPVTQHRQPVIGLNVLRKVARMPPQQQAE
nr:hypothetical protein [Tanacetum cinerariifolium]